MQRCLEAAGLSQYTDVFVREGFDDLDMIRRRAATNPSALVKELNEDLCMPKGHARKLLWHLEGLDAPKPEEVKREIKEEPDPPVQQAPLVEQTHYDVLQVDVAASFRQIRQAYLKLVVVRHPDKPGGTTAGFQLLEAAYDVLSDAARRRDYDSKIGAHGLKAPMSCQQEMDGQYDINALWTTMLKAGSGCWVSWLAALPTAALAGLQQHGRRSSPASSRPTPALTQALVAAGSFHLTDVQLEAELSCGRDILTSLAATPTDASPLHLLVDELVQAIRPAATRVWSRQAVDAQLMSKTLEQLLAKLLGRTKWAGRYRCVLQSSMAEVTQAYMTSAGFSPETMVLAEPSATSANGPEATTLQEPIKKQNGHYYRSGKGWMTKVVVKSVHMTSQTSKNLVAVAEARASMASAKRLTEAAVEAGVDFAQALHDAVQAARPQCLTPLVWQYSYDARELVQQAGMTPSTPVLEEMVQHREELMLRVGGALGSRLTGADLKGLCNHMRQKRKEVEQAGGEERLQKAAAGLAKMVKQELDCRNLVPMLVGAANEDPMSDDQKATTIPARRRAADRLASRFLEEGKLITESQVLAVLNEWGFEENTSRQNVTPRGRSFVYSDTMGAVRARSGAVLVTQATVQYPHVNRVICNYFQQQDAIPHTSMCINKNYPSKRHRDAGNEGPSAIKAFGKHDGGDLMYWPRDTGKEPVLTLAESAAAVLDIRSAVTIFDGNRGHATKPFKGIRYSIVLFTVKGFETLQGHQRHLALSYVI